MTQRQQKDAKSDPEDSCSQVDCRSEERWLILVEEAEHPFGQKEGSEEHGHGAPEL